MPRLLTALRSAAFALGAGVALSLAIESSAFASDYANAHLLIETAQLSERLDEENLRIIDVRSAADYAKGHIPGAVRLGADDVIDPDAPIAGHLRSPEAMAQRLGALGIDKDTFVVLYDDKGGFHASRLFWMLEHFGHRKVALLNGGIPKWLDENREISTKAAMVKRKRFVVNLVPRRSASADWLLERRDDPNTVVIDVRPTKLHKAGHIPWARSIPWKQNLTEQGTMKSAEVLLAHFAAHGVTPDKNVAVHCQDGKASAHSYFTLRLLGFSQIRSYDRSWAEWGTADELPKASGIAG